jgi:hypothetical protein
MLTRAARQWMRRAALDLAVKAGGRIMTRPLFRHRPDLNSTTVEAEPMAGMHAARELEHAARQLTREYIRRAREDGYSWKEIGEALDLRASAEHRGISVAEAAYNDAAGGSDSEHARRYGRSFIWTCPVCRHAVSDKGPCNGPAEDEQGHAESCSRLADTSAAWEASWNETGPGR